MNLQILDITRNELSWQKTKHESSTIDIAFHQVHVPIEKTVSMLSLTLPQLITLFTDTWQIYYFDMNCNGCGYKNSKFIQVQSTLHIIMWLSLMFEVKALCTVPLDLTSGSGFAIDYFN
jgi:hypothetical protein